MKKLLKDDLNVCKATEKFLFNFQSNNQIYIGLN